MEINCTACSGHQSSQLPGLDVIYANAATALDFTLNCMLPTKQGGFDLINLLFYDSNPL